MTEKNYIREIDGLRAIAVSGVIFFHLGAALPGGYVGVDVFFVISGYLITRLIFKEITETGSLSYPRFYARRIRRLFPALFATLALCLVASSILFPPDQLQRLGLSLVHAIFSISNFLFWSESGYFDLEAIKKPLLHTWSLSIEEQFYLLWPLSLVAICKLGKGWRPAVIVSVLALTSLAGAEVYFRKDPSAVFYLMPFRVFEFMIGALLVWIPPITNKRMLECVLSLGLLLIGLAMFLLKPSTPFPGVYALLPSIGAALAILGAQAKHAGALLRNAPMAYIGVISYSLYLLHWPIIVFYQHATLDPPSVIESALLLLLTILGAAIMHRFVESPFRSGANPIQLPRIGLISALASLLLIIPASTLYLTGGWPDRLKGRLSPEIKANVPPGSAWNNITSINGNLFSSPEAINVLVIGDSQAGDFTNILVELLDASKYELTANIVDVHCGALYLQSDEVGRYLKANRRVQESRNEEHMLNLCSTQWRAWTESSNLERADVIVLASLWHDYQVPYLKQTLAYIKSKSNARIVLIGNKTLTLSSQEIATRCALLSFGLPFQCGLSPASLNKFAAIFIPQDSVILNEKLKQLAASNGISMLDLYSLVCPDKAFCKVFDDEGYATYRDAVHLNPRGVSMLVNSLQESGSIFPRLPLGRPKIPESNSF